MNQYSKFKTILSSFTLAVVLCVSTGLGAVSAKSEQPSAQDRPAVLGEQAKPPIEPGSQDAKEMKSLGSTNLVTGGQNDTLSTDQITPLAGNIAGIDFSTHLKYCWKNLLYATVKNTTGSAKSVHVRVFNQGSWRDLYTTVAANSTAYPAFYGINGAYNAHLYVWNGSTYQYDESVSSSLTCNVAVTRVTNAGGWVRLKIQNLGNAYATQISNELAPFPATGTYTGLHYDYPVAGGVALYRWFWVGSQPYGITSLTQGSFNAPYFFTGDL